MTTKKKKRKIPAKFRICNLILLIRTGLKVVPPGVPENQVSG